MTTIIKPAVVFIAASSDVFVLEQCVPENNIFKKYRYIKTITIPRYLWQLIFVGL